MADDTDSLRACRPLPIRVGFGRWSTGAYRHFHPWAGFAIRGATDPQEATSLGVIPPESAPFSSINILVVSVLGLLA